MESLSSNFFTSTHMAFEDEASIFDISVESTSSLERADPLAIPLGQYYFQAFNLPFSPEITTDSPSPGSCSPIQCQLQYSPYGSMGSDKFSNLKSTRTPRRESSEEKETLTPAQSRRKAQNRAAQRAFRERKEKHMKDVEAKLEQLTKKTSSLQSDNARLRLLLQRVQTENDVLRATIPPSLSPHHQSKYEDNTDWLTSSLYSTTLPDIYNSSPRVTAVPQSSTHCSLKSSSSKTSRESHLLSASATWHLIQSHPLYLRGAVDIGQVCEKLREISQRDGMELMFDKEEVRNIIEEVGRVT